MAANDSAGEQKPKIELTAKEARAGEADLEALAPYVSPEVAQRQPESAASDVYCLGVILYEMLAGNPPFTAGSPAAVIVEAALPRAPSPVTGRVAEVSPLLQDLVLRALEKEPSSRPQSAARFKRELESALSPKKAEPTPTRMMTGEGFRASVHRGTPFVAFPRSPCVDGSARHRFGMPASQSVGSEAPLPSKPPSSNIPDGPPDRRRGRSFTSGGDCSGLGTRYAYRACLGPASHSGVVTGSAAYSSSRAVARSTY